MVCNGKTNRPSNEGLLPRPRYSEKIRERHFTLKTSQMFFVNTTPENARITGHYLFEEMSGGEITVSVSSRHRLRKAPFSKSN